MNIIRLFLFFLFLSILAGKTNASSEYELNSNTITKRYLTKLKNTGSGAVGAFVVPAEGFPNFLVKKNYGQSVIEQEALSICNKKYKDCQVLLRGFKKNKKYSAVKYSSGNLRMFAQDIKVREWFKYGNIIIFKKDKTGKIGALTCKDYSKKTKYDAKVEQIVKDTVKAFPKKFLNNSGLKYVVLCEQIVGPNNAKKQGIALSAYNYTTGVFLMTNLISNAFEVAEKNYLQNKKDCAEVRKKHKNFKCTLRTFDESFSSNTNSFLQLFAHELYHIIDQHMQYGHEDKEYQTLNQYPYLGRGNPETYKKIRNGFVSYYAQTNISEDKADLFTAMIMDRENLKNKLKEDKILLRKSKIIIKRLKQLYPTLNSSFWFGFEKVKLINKI